MMSSGGSSGGYGVITGGAVYGKDYAGGNVQIAKSSSPIPIVYSNGTYTIQSPSLKNAMNYVKKK